MKKILIIEDNKEVALLYQKLLNINGYDTTVAFDGLEGLDRLKEMTPDLILLDVSMPRLSGVGFYQEVLDAAGYPKYPILVITGRIDLEITFKHFPVAGVLLKPVDRNNLLNQINDILEHSKEYLLNNSAN